MKSDPTRERLIEELNRQADVYEKYHSEGWKFYDNICNKYKVACLEEMTTTQLAETADGICSKKNKKEAN